MTNQDLIYSLYKDKRTVFSLQEIAMLVDEPDFSKLKQRINYYVRTNKIRNPRRSIYTKEAYSVEELACKIFKPAYISLEYVLQKSGMMFQYNSQVTTISYLSRAIQIDARDLVYRKIRNDLLYNTTGIIMDDHGISMATPDRAFLDTIYLNGAYHFDSLKPLDREKVLEMLPFYQSGPLYRRVEKLFKDAGYQQT